MANSIALFKQYIPMLDEVYAAASLTADLDGASELVSQGANANELIIPKMTMDGMANYNRNTGYVAGDVTMTNETVACNYDRGRMFAIDNLDNAETAGVAFGRLAAEFIRTKVVPELDAFRLGKYLTLAGTKAGASLTTGAAAIAAIRVGIAAMDDAEVPAEERYLYITPTILGLIEDLDTTKSRAVMDSFAKVQKVPQSRFGKTVTLTAGGGYTVAGDANFLIVHKPAVIQFQKHVAPKVVTPEQNQDADAWKFGYRNVGIADVYDNKVNGIYAHTVSAS